MIHPLVKYGLFLLVASAFLAGCAGLQTRRVDWDRAEFPIGWPEPPDVERIRLLNVFPTKVQDKQKTPQEKFLNWLTGGDQSEPPPLVTPYDVVADGEGRVWVSDTEGGVLHVFDLATDSHEVWNTFDGIKLISPVGLGIDPQRGTIYLCDAVVNWVLDVVYQGQLLREIEAPEGFQRPTDILPGKDGQIYVSDTLRGEVLVFDAKGQFIKSIGSGISPDGKFNLQVNLDLAADGQMAIVDSMNFRVELFDGSGASIGSIGGLGDSPGHFARPRGIAIDSESHIYVADAAFNNIQIFNREGQLLLYFGESGFNPGQFMLPAGLFFDQDDRLYVVDSYNQRIQLFQYLKGGE